MAAPPDRLKRFVDQNIVLKLLEYFYSDPQERDYFRSILLFVYGKFVALRFFVRRTI